MNVLRVLHSNIVFLVRGRGLLENEEGRNVIVKSGLLSGLNFDEYLTVAVNRLFSDIADGSPSLDPLVPDEKGEH